MLHGELFDQFEEFFVAVRTGLKVGHSVWQDTYYLRAHMLPTFLSFALAQKILVIGKSLNFIRSCRQKLLHSVKDKAKEMVPSRNAVGRGKLKEGMAKPSVASALGYKSTDGVGEDELLQHQRRERLEERQRQVQQIHLIDAVDRFRMPLGKGAPHEASGGRTSPVQASPSLVEIPPDEKGRSYEVMGDGNDVVMRDECDFPPGADDDDLIGVTDEVEASLHGLRYGGEVRLGQLVDKLAVAVDTRLLCLMELDFCLTDHLAALKKFMLLGQGDFVTCLMDALGPELQKPATKLYRHNLNGILEGALRASNAQFEGSHVLNRITVRLLEAQQGDTGWEVFTLDYAIDAPLNAVVGFVFWKMR